VWNEPRAQINWDGGSTVQHIIHNSFILNKPYNPFMHSLLKLFDLTCFVSLSRGFQRSHELVFEAPIIISRVTHTHPSINSSPCFLWGSNALWILLREFGLVRIVFEIQNLVNCRLSVETLVLDSLVTETRMFGLNKFYTNPKPYTGNV
jgi:hypothetical protein